MGMSCNRGDTGSNDNNRGEIAATCAMPSRCQCFHRSMDLQCCVQHRAHGGYVWSGDQRE